MQNWKNVRKFSYLTRKVVWLQDMLSKNEGHLDYLQVVKSLENFSESLNVQAKVFCILPALTIPPNKHIFVW